MLTNTVWVMISIVHSGISFGPEFHGSDAQQRCEIAAKTIQQTMSNISNMNGWVSRVPTCVRIEK